ncbi:MAG: IS5 family transposase [Chitinophagaceae bacterium]|nr:MAG: IS5 family transposase [Chitinophagaceae bacterium]
MAKPHNQRLAGGLFIRREGQAKLSSDTTVLDVMDLTLDWEMFRPVLDQNLDFKEPESGHPSKGGCPAFNAVLMFKVLVLQKYHALSDDQYEYQINYQHSFQRFPRLEREGRLPNAKTIWRFCERLGRERVQALFSVVDGFLRDRVLPLRAGKMIDARFVDVPRQRNTRQENQQIKDGQMSDGWEQKSALHRQKDTDARQTRRRDERHCGYKNYVTGDLVTKLIETWTVTDASMHDSQALPELINEDMNQDTILYADNICRSAATEFVFEQHRIENRTHEHPWRNTPLNDAQKASNQKKSRLRAPVEHIFGEHSAHRSNSIRTVGKTQAWFQWTEHPVAQPSAGSAFFKGRLPPSEAPS